MNNEIRWMNCLVVGMTLGFAIIGISLVKVVMS